KNKVKHIQFSPLVESSPLETEQARGQHFGSNLIFSTDKRHTVPQKYEPIAWSVDAKEYGRFLTDVFHLWVSQDVGKV
ncbi:anaerobic sulfatase maturase, partial [Vibrio parahaemolyticus]